MQHVRSRDCEQVEDVFASQVMAVPMSRQASGMSVHELRLPSSNSVTAYRLAAQPPLAHANPGNRAKSGCVAYIIQLMRPILLCGKQQGLPMQ